MLGWFRRHATILMVVLGSAAMVIFGLGSVFNSIANSAGQKAVENPTIAEWKGGKLTREDIGRVYRTHAESRRFLAAVIDAAEEKSGDRVTPLAELIAPIRAEDEEQQMTSVLSRMMMAQAAEKQGFVVGDRMVNEYIALVSGDAQFSKADLEKINRKVNQTSLDVVREHLKVELMAMQMSGLTAVGMNLPPNPTEAISLYGRTAERIECEVIPIPVKDFVSKVTATPPESELRELYNAGKSELPDPYGEKPGFKVDRKINVQYLVARSETFLLNEMNKITDEDVQKEYDRLVAKNDMMVVEPMVKDNAFAIPGLDGLPEMVLPKLGDGNSNSNPDDAPLPPTDGAPAPPADDAPAPPADDASVPPTDPPTPPSDGTATPSDGNGTPSDGNGTPSDDAPGAETTPEAGTAPATEVTPGGEVPQGEVPEGEITPPAPNESSHVVRGKRAQFVSTQDPVINSSDVQETPAELQKPEAAVTPGGQVADPVADPVAQAVEQDAPAAGEAAADQTDSQPPAADTESVELPQADAPQAGGIGADIEEELKKQEAAPERKYKPLSDVAEDIRRSLALPLANEKMSLAIETIQHEIDDYFFELDSWENEDSGDESIKPTLPDLDAMAKKYNLQLKQTGLVDREEMKLDPLGSIQVGSDTLGNYLFFMAGDKELYEATPFSGATPLVPDYYLFWNIENENPHVVDFADCKDQVVEFWKEQQALKLAEKEAEAISVKVNNDRRSKMSELYPERALPTGQFSWFDTMRGGILSQPGNVEKPSDEFMETAFSLNKLEAGVAVDRNRDTVYVIQSVSGSRPVDELGADYLQNKFMKTRRVPREVVGAALYYNRLEQGKAGKELKKELGFEYDSEFAN